MNKALYVGSFNPITNGHLWVIQEASKLFDELVVVIASNNMKEDPYKYDNREYYIKDSIRDLKNTTVVKMPNVFHIDYAEELNAQYLVRGIRNPIDLEQETQILRFNENRNNSIRPVFLMPPKELSDLSSSLVKSLIGIKGWEKEVFNMVPLRVFEDLIKNNLKCFHEYVGSFVEDFNKHFMTDLHSFVLIDKIKEYYDGKIRRFYHNLEHLNNCFKWFEIISHVVSFTEEDKLALKAAILFHDSIYEIGDNVDPGNNERKSGTEAINFFMEYDHKFSDLVYHIIKATDYSDPTDYVRYSTLEPYMRDIDLAELASNYDNFTENTMKVMCEYMYIGNYSPSEVVNGRIKFLENFSKRKLFSTKYFSDKLEQTAHENIKKELENKDELFDLLKKNTRNFRSI